MSTQKTLRKKRLQYGLEWDAKLKPVEIELEMFLNYDTYCETMPELRMMGRAYHFKQIVNWYWGPSHKKHFIWNPWNERMLNGLIEGKWVWFSGCAGSGKTDMLAIWGLVNWMVAPMDTVVLFTSTSLKESRTRVWGRVEDYFIHAGLWSKSSSQSQETLPGKLVSSMGKIVTINPEGKAMPDHYGLHLIAGEKSKEKENIGKLIGVHNKRVFLLLDEMPELSPALIEAARGNLQINQFFQMAGAGNFKSIFDPFGVATKPKAGWSSINLESEEWETERGGKCLRFDGPKSPNVLAGYQKYPGLYGPDDLANHRMLGEHTAQFWRMCRSFICQSADADRVYFEADLLKGRTEDRVKWKEEPTRVASLDPAWATGGDRAQMCYGLLGRSTEDRWVLQLEEMIEIREDVRILDKSRSYQVAVGYRDACEARQVKPEHACFDGSGGGLPFGALLTELWNNRPLSVQFGGAASERIASIKDRRPSSKVYTNRVTELWFSGVDFVLSGQIKGLDPETGRELQERRYETIKGPSGLRLRVERKDEMKQRTGGVSPDRADAFLILLELCRERLGFSPVGLEQRRQRQDDSWFKTARLVHDAQGERAADYREEVLEESVT